MEILQFADYLKEKIREAKELIDKIVMSVFYDMFGDPATNPKGWEVKKLSEIADINPRNFIPENWNDEKEVEKDVLFAKITPCVENKKVALVRNLLNFMLYVQKRA